MKNLLFPILNINFRVLLSISVVLLIFVLSCQKENNLSLNKSLDKNELKEDLKNEFRTSCFTEQEFLTIAEGFTGFFDQMNDVSQRNMETKLDSLYRSIGVLIGDTISFNTLARIYQKDLLVDSINVAIFLNTLYNNRNIITASGFSQCFYDELVNQVGEESFGANSGIESRWFLATLAAALGAGPCTQAALGCLDACCGVAGGILTAPTGIGAAVNWATTGVSYGAAMVNLHACVHQ